MSEGEYQGRVVIKKEIFPGTVLRSAGPRDIPQLMRLEASVEDVSGLHKWNIQRWLYEVNTNYVWLIEQGLEAVYVVGFIHNKEKAEIDVIKLTAGPTGKPFTSKLIQHGAQVVMSMGVTRIRGRCAEHLLDFYGKLGFVQVGIIPHYFGLNTPAYSIERIL